MLTSVLYMTNPADPKKYILKNSTDWSMISSGVLISRKICGARKIPTSVNTRLETSPSATVVWTASDVILWSLAPIKRAITTLHPIVKPWMKPISKKIRFPEELTAASAELPKKFPTISESAVLYICWNRLPKKIGIAKYTIFFLYEPSVITALSFFKKIQTSNQIQQSSLYQSSWDFNVILLKNAKKTSWCLRKSDWWFCLP